MTPSSLRTRSLHARLGVFFAGFTVAATLGVGASPVLFAQQPPRAPTPRRPEAPIMAAAPAPRGAASTVASKAGEKRLENRAEKRPAGGSAAKAAPLRAPVADRAAPRVQQTSSMAERGAGVVLAGGAAAVEDCRQCGRRGCGTCRSTGDRAGLPCNGLCDQGGCPAHCPVRPDQFGYYATRWRAWPGRGVKQVGHFDPATTPAVPPRSEVPGMEEELALPSQRDETPPEDEDEEEANDMLESEAAAAGDGEAATSSEDARKTDQSDEADKSAKADKAEGDVSTAESSGTTGGDGIDPKSREKAKSSKPRVDGLLDTDGADATRPMPDGAWSNWSRTSTGEQEPLTAESVVRTSGPAERAEEVSPSGDRREGAKLRSPAQRMVEGSDRAVGRWRAKATASGEASGESAANPLRGVTAQPGNPLR